MFRAQQKSKHKSRTIRIGQLGEDKAAQYLQSKGYRILDRNWRTKYGELDIVCEKGGNLIFVEVKSRTSRPGAERFLTANITRRKQRKLRSLAYCYYNKKFFSRLPVRFRIDVIGVCVDLSRQDSTYIEHLVGCVGSAE